MTKQLLLAYVDPGAGAILWQIVAASLASSVFFCRKWIARFLPGKKNKKP